MSLKRFSATTLAALILSSCVSFAAIKPPPTPVREYTQQEIPSLIASDKLVILRSSYRGRSADGFRGKEIAENEVLHKASRDGKSAVLIEMIGRAQENWGGGQALFDIVEASSVELIDPTPANVGQTLAKLDHVHRVEARSAMRLVVALKQTELSPTLLAYIKAREVGAYVDDVVSAYAAIEGAGAREELLKVLKFHSSPNARVSAGASLLSLGDRAAVESAMAEEKAPDVVRSLNQLLLES